MKQFPLLKTSSQRREYPDWPDGIPWAMIREHARQAIANHGQSLERLAERGGLSPLEMMCVLLGKELGYYGLLTHDAVEFIIRAVAEWTKEQGVDPT